MPENSILSTLIQSFASTNKEQWKRAASREINGEDPFEKLFWDNDDEIKFFPYYDREDLSRYSSKGAFELQPAANSFLGPRAWQCAPLVTVTREEKANQAARDHLANGAEAVFFDMRAAQTMSFDRLLHEIEWPYCSILYHLQHGQSENLRKYVSRARWPFRELSGAFFWERPPEKGLVDFFLIEMPRFRALGLSVPADTAARQILHALVEGVRAIEALSPVYDRVTLVRSIAFSITAGSNFMETIARLKVLRGLWFQVVKAYGIDDYAPSDLYIHVMSNNHVSDYQPQGNMIVTTLCGMASVLGGCDALTLRPEEEDQSMMDRVARNISAVLREEAHLNKVADPLAGSYALEVMVREIALKAWSMFQHEMKR